MQISCCKLLKLLIMTKINYYYMCFYHIFNIPQLYCYICYTTSLIILLEEHSTYLSH